MERRALSPEAAVAWTAPNSQLAGGRVNPAIAPNGKLLAIAQGLLNAESGARLKDYGGLATVSWHPDNRHLLGTYDGCVIVRDTQTLVDEYVIVPLPSEQVAVFDTAGNLVRGEVADIDDYLVYFVDGDDGERETLKPSEFAKRYQ